MRMNVSAVIAEHNAAIACVLALEDKLHKVIEDIRGLFARGDRLYVCGNGGSASDAQHFAAELTGRYSKDRPGYPAIALNTDTSAITAISNDYGYDAVFSRQLESLACRGDMLLAISTSGNSSNIIQAVQSAKKLGISTIGLLGRDGGEAGQMVDCGLIIDVPQTARIQEAHILILHLICEAFEPA